MAAPYSGSLCNPLEKNPEKNNNIQMKRANYTDLKTNSGLASSIDGRSSRRRPVFYWDCEDVLKWLRKYCGQMGSIYAELFRAQAINGRALLRLTDWKLKMMNIQPPEHREEIMRHIMRLKFRTETAELKTLQDKSLEGDKLTMPEACS